MSYIFIWALKWLFHRKIRKDHKKFKTWPRRTSYSSFGQIKFITENKKEHGIKKKIVFSFHANLFFYSMFFFVFCYKLYLTKRGIRCSSRPRFKLFMIFSNFSMK